MANIIQMRTTRTELKTRARQSAERTGEIVIFPGIRYERWSSSEQKSEGATPTPARDILKLVE